MSAIFSDPPIFGGLCNSNIRANKNTPLDLSQAAPTPIDPTEKKAPSKAPSQPIGTNSTESSITVSFDVNGITGTAPLTYGVYYSTFPDSYYNTDVVEATLLSSTTYTATIPDLENDTLYYIASVASNDFGKKVSATNGLRTTIQTPPSSAPSEPVLVDAGGSSLFVTFDITGILGSQPITYMVEYGLDESLGSTAVATPYNGSLTEYSVTVSDLDSGTGYYMASISANSYGSIRSAVAGPFTTLA